MTSPWVKANDWLKRQKDAPPFLVKMAATRAARYERQASRPKPKGALSVRSLTHKLDDVFSRYIRLRDRLASTSGACACVTCGRFAEWKEMDCGHFMSRGFMATRWHEQNCATQCRKCNRFQEGLHAEFAKAIDKRWGKGTADKLMGAARIGRKKWLAFELQAHIGHYEARVKELETQGER